MYPPNWEVSDRPHLVGDCCGRFEVELPLFVMYCDYGTNIFSGIDMFVPDTVVYSFASCQQLQCDRTKSLWQGHLFQPHKD